jgi:transketolase C-terminal domain/subunit
MKSSPMNELENQLTDLMKFDKRIVILTADVAKSTKIDGISKNYPHRFINVGIAEQDLIGTAAGLAHMGLRPFIVAYSAYITQRPFEQIKTAVGLLKLPLKIIGTHSGLTAYSPGDRSLEDISLMRNVDNMTIYTPSFSDELEFSLRQCDFPTYIRLPHYRFEFQHPNCEDVASLRCVADRDSNIAILTYGLGLHRVLENDMLFRNYDIFNLLNQTISGEELIRRLSKYDEIRVIQDHKCFGSIVDQLKGTFYNQNHRPKILHVGPGSNLKSYGNPCKTIDGFIGEVSW